jgi:HEAT repeat protein
MPDRRIDLIKWFCEHKGMTDDEIIPRVVPYLTDFDENSRFSAIEGIANRDPKKIGEPLIDALLRPEEESGRIKRTILEVLEKTKAPLGDRAARVAGTISGPLANDFKVDAGVVKKK